MTTAFLSEGVWLKITEAVSGSKQPCYAAAAYFGKGASHQLPLFKGSRLVVNASDSCVAAGATCPAELTKLLKRGVRIFNEPTLHAKVFVVGKTAYIGSTNVSENSASRLTEAAIRTTDLGSVRAARKFVEDNCNDELGPERLKALAKIYRPPKVPGGLKGKTMPKRKRGGPTIPRVFLAQLVQEEWSEQEQTMHDEGKVTAKKFRKHPRAWIQDGFRWSGKCRYSKDDKVIQVTDVGGGKLLVDAPGTVLYVRPPEKIGRKLTTFVYLERPDRKRRSTKALAKSHGYTQKQLKANGLVKNQAFAQSLLRALDAAS